jgi:hypothetical protein
MAYNTKAILTDVNQKPIPQFYDAVNDVYRQLTGQTLGGNNYGSNTVSWGKTAGGLFAPVAVNDSGHVQSDILSSALPSGAATQAKQDALAALIGEVQASPTANTLLARLKSLEDKIDAITDGTSPAVTQLSGSNVEIGGVTFAVSGGDTLRGKSADKPDAVAAHAVIPYCYYFSVDTGIVEVTDGTNWVVI